MAPKKLADTEIPILRMAQGRISFAVIGTTPFIFNRMSSKVKMGLLAGTQKKTAAEKQAHVKHDPVNEFRDSVYRNKGGDRATRLTFPAPAFKGAMLTAALDMPNTRRTEIGRRVWVEGLSVDVYGTPELLMSVVRSSDINRTPDIRTRAILPQWACVVSVNFVEPLMNATAVGHLMAAAGVIAGVGDFRQEKGKGNYGQFRLSDADDPEFRAIVANGGRVVQDEALEHYRCYDDETQELLTWYDAEVKRTGRKPKESTRDA